MSMLGLVACPKRTCTADRTDGIQYCVFANQDRTSLARPKPGHDIPKRTGTSKTFKKNETIFEKA